MPSSLVKFANRKVDGRGGNLHWNRVDRDNLPYRGQFAPMFKEDEWEERTVRVVDARNAFFDVKDEASNKEYLDVLECCMNGWFNLVHLERFWVDPSGNRTTLHYVEWSEYYMEDGSRTPYSAQRIMELENGQQNGIGNFGAC